MASNGWNPYASGIKLSKAANIHNSLYIHGRIPDFYVYTVYMEGKINDQLTDTIPDFYVYMQIEQSGQKKKKKTNQKA